MAVVAGLFVAGAVTGPFDPGGLFLPVTAVSMLLLAPPTFAVVDRHRRRVTAVMGAIITGLAVVGLAAAPGPFRLIAAILVLLIGLLLLTGAAYPAVARRMPRLFPGARD